MPRAMRRSAGLLPCARPRSSRGGQRRRRQSSMGERPFSGTSYLSTESFPPSPKNSTLPSSLPTAEPIPHTLDPIHNTLHVPRPPVYAPTRTYVPVRVSDFVAVTPDRFAAVSDALGPVDCARRPPSYQLYPPSSTSHPPESHYRHSLPAHVDVGVQVNEQLHSFSPVSPTHPIADHDNNSVTNENTLSHHPPNSAPQNCSCSHRPCHRPSTFRASVPPLNTMPVVGAGVATASVKNIAADHGASDVFLIDGQDYVTRLADIVTSYDPSQLQSVLPGSHPRIHSTPLPSPVPSPTTPEAHSTDPESNQHASENAVIDSIDTKDTDPTLVLNELKLARPIDATVNTPSFGVSRASTILSSLSLGATSSTGASLAISADSAQSEPEDNHKKVDELITDEEEPLTPSQVHFTISPHLLNFPDVLAVPSISPCRSPSPISNLRQRYPRSLRPPRLLSHISAHRGSSAVVPEAATAHASILANGEEHDEGLSEVHPFLFSECGIEDAHDDSPAQPISPVDSLSRFERVSELFREDEYENDDHDDLHHHSSDDDDLVEIPSNPSVFIAVTSARTLSDLMSVQDEECSSSRLDCDGEDKDEITPIAHRVIPSLWLRPQSSACPKGDPSPLLTSPCPALPSTPQDPKAPASSSDHNPQDESLKVSTVTKSETASGSEKGAGSVGISPRRGNAFGKNGVGGGNGGSGSVSLSPSRLFRKSWTKRKSSESGLTSSSTEYYEDDYLKFMEGSCPSSRPPLRLLPHPAFARLIGADGRALRASRFDCSESSISVSTSDEEYRPFCGNSG